MCESYFSMLLGINLADKTSSMGSAFMTAAKSMKADENEASKPSPYLKDQDRSQEVRETCLLQDRSQEVRETYLPQDRSREEREACFLQDRSRSRARRREACLLPEMSSDVCYVCSSIVQDKCHITKCYRLTIIL
jgi:hypothetical protein